MKSMMGSLVGGMCVAALLLLTPRELRAACAPLTPEQLEHEANHIVTGKVSAIEIRSEHSEMEGFGSFDFAIYYRIAVNTVERGEGVKPGDELVARCFRAKTLLSFVQTVGWLSGHHPIPKPGQPVPAYLQRRGLAYHAIYPNGFTPMGGGQLVELDSRQLRSWLPPFTLLLPLDLWVLVVILVLLLVAILAVFGPKSRRMQDVKLVLAFLSALWTVGLIAGFAQFLAATHEWVVGTIVAIVGIFVVSAFGRLTVRLFLSARRKLNSQAKAKADVSGASA
jgi:hypothetical protein